MSHVYFEVSAFPFHREEAIEFLNLLCAIENNQGRIDLMYQQTAGGLPPLNTSNAPDIVWKEALQKLTSHGALRKLCDQLKVSKANNAAFQRVLQVMEEAKTATETRIISSDIVILDRSELRQKIDLITPENNRAKVLLVRGDSQSGKSHGRFLFELAALEKGAEYIYLYNGLVTTLSDVINQLFSTIGTLDDIPSPPLTSPEAWYTLISLKLHELAKSQNKVYWIAVDDLGNDPDGESVLDKQIRLFFNQFALNLPGSSFRRHFRLMLIHYPSGSAPTKWTKEIYTETFTKETDVQQTDVEKALQEWRTTNNLNITDTSITKYAASIIAKADNPTPEDLVAPRLQRIHDSLTNTLQQLKPIAV